MDRRRKNSIYDTNPPAIVASQKQLTSRRRKSYPPNSKRQARDKDFFVPDDIDEWVLPEYRSLFHHIFLREEEESGSSSPTPGGRRCSVGSLDPRRRKISPSGSTTDSTSSTSTSTSQTSTEEDGPFCNLVSWLKKVFHISNDNEQQQIEENSDRHAWLDEIPIEICDRLRHIHIYV